MYVTDIKNASLDLMIHKELSHKQVITIAKEFKDILDEQLKPYSYGTTRIHHFQFYDKIQENS